MNNTSDHEITEELTAKVADLIETLLTLEYVKVNNDELVEVTPLSFRMRKRILNTSERKKYDSYVHRGEE